MIDQYLEPDEYDRWEPCRECIDHENKEDYLKEILTFVMNQIYGDSPVDTESLDDLLKDMCKELGVDVAVKTPTICRIRKESPMFEFAKNQMYDLAQAYNQ